MHVSSASPYFINFLIHNQISKSKEVKNINMNWKYTY